MKVSVILPAAGLGTRMAGKSGTSRKQFMLLEGARDPGAYHPQVRQCLGF